MNKWILMAGILFFSPLMAQAACSSSDFKVDSFKVDLNPIKGTLQMKGNLINNCSEPGAAQLLIEAKDSAGNVVQDRKLWPAGTSNIAPGDKASFDAGRMFRYRETMQTYSISVVDVRTW